MCCSIPWVMPQRFLDQQLPLEQTDTPKRDVPPENYCNASLYICDNVYSGLPWQPANLSTQQDHRQKYRAAVSWTDFNVGRVLQTLEEEGFANETAVVFNGDHGAPSATHPIQITSVGTRRPSESCDTLCISYPNACDWRLVKKL